MNASPVVIVALAAVAAAASPPARSSDQDPPFRARTTRVPVSVRALDRNGDPVGVLDGEKHVIFVTPDGLVGLSTFYQDRLASLASDAADGRELRCRTARRA
jgi:hypothetical protein